VRHDAQMIAGSQVGLAIPRLDLAEIFRHSPVMPCDPNSIPHDLDSTRSQSRHRGSSYREGSDAGVAHRAGGLVVFAITLVPPAGADPR